MSLLSKLSNCFGIARFSVDTPLGQKQQTPSIPSATVRPPLDGLPRRSSAAASTLPPRGALPTAPERNDAAGNADAPGPADPDAAAAQPQPGHMLLDEMAQSEPDCFALTKVLFGPKRQGFGVTEGLVYELEHMDFSRMPPIPGLPGAPTVILAEALAAATGGDARLALGALERLQEFDPQKEIAAAWQQRAGGPDDDAASLDGGNGWPRSAAPRPSDADRPGDDTLAAKRAMWQVAAALANTPMGLDVLQAIVARPVDAAHYWDFAVLLKAANGMPQGYAERDDPAAILASAAALDTLTGKAAACAAARMAGDVAAALPHQWALTAVRNDLFEAGPGTDFSAVNHGRLMKTGRWIERATPERGRLLRNPMFGKSPFRALRHGTQKVERGPAVARHLLARETALREAAATLKDQLIDAAPRMRSPGPGQAPQGLLRAAVLEHCLQTPAPQPLERAGFDEAACADIADRLALLLSPAPRPGLAGQLAQSPQVQALADLRLDAELMGRWFSEARKATGNAQAQAVHDVPWVQAISAAFARAEEEVQGRDTRVPVITRETLRSAVQDIIANIEGSSRLRLSSGGLVGVGLRQITSSITAVASAFFLRGRIDGRAQRGRQAVFEIAMTPYAMELVLGSQRQVTRQLGFGAFVGPDIGVAKAGVNVDALLCGREDAELQGISIRLPRIGRPMPDVRAEFSTVVNAVIDGSEGGMHADDPTPLLQRLLQDFSDLTVSRIGLAGDGRSRHGLGADLMGSVGKWGAKVSAGIGGFVEAQRNVTKYYADATGRMRVERSIEGNTARVGVGAKVLAGPSASVASGTSFSGGVEASLAVAQFGVVAEHILSGVLHRREAVYEDGRLHPMSFVEKEYQKPGAFLNAMEPQIGEWVEAGADPARLDDLLTDIRDDALPTHSFAMRRTVTPEARARDNAYRSSMILCAKHPSGLPEAVLALDAKVESQWKDPANKQPHSLRSYERNLAQKTRGVDVVVQVVSVEAAEASHIHHRLDVPAQRPRRP